MNNILVNFLRNKIIIKVECEDTRKYMKFK